MNTIGNLRPIGIRDPDFSHVLKMDQNWFPRPWSFDSWINLNPEHHILLIWEKPTPIGFALFTHLPGDETTHLLKICLDPKLRGGEEAGTFWCAVSGFLKQAGLLKIYLEVEVTNSRAIGFYKKHGFQSLRQIKSYYSDGADAFTMDLLL